MAKFAIFYLGGNKEMSPEDAKAHRQGWQVWLNGLGEAVVSPANPLKGSKSVSRAGVSDADGVTRITGYTIVEAPDMEAALAMAKDCPFLDMGTLEVAEMMSMGG
ncbi:MAG TPA: hypothetical protein ENJ90_05100 [Devosia sp.]|nr:hypothetical protein [Devosia sp.]